MSQTNAFLVIVIGLLLLYATITGKLGLVETFFYQLFDIPTDKLSDTGKDLTGAAVQGAITPNNIEDILYPKTVKIPTGGELPVPQGK